MNPALISLAMQVGAPLVRQILSRKIGAKNAELAEEVVSKIAANAGVSVGAELDEIAENDPQIVIDAITEVEAEAPELLALYAQGLEGQFALLQAEQKDPLWYRAWRPAGMYVIGFLWLWDVVLLHVFNAIFKIALPPASFEVLLQLSMLYMGLYMGGHTAKDMMRSFALRGRG